MRRVLALVADRRIGGGECGALLDLLTAMESGHAATVELASRIQEGSLAECSTGLSLEGMLALASRQPHSHRRSLATVAATLRSMPCLRAAFHAGAVGFAEVRAVVAESVALTAEQRETLDATFSDVDRLGRMDPDRVVDGARDAVARLLPAREEADELRRIERRYVQIQPAFDGALTLYAELDPEAGTTFLEALEAACPPPGSGTHDVTRRADETVTDDTSDSAAGNHACGGRTDIRGGTEAGPDAREGHVGTDGLPSAEAAHDGFGDACARPDRAGGSHAPGGGHESDTEWWERGERRRSRGRQRADGLLHLAETFLGGVAAGTDGTVRRPRPRMLVVTDLSALAGDDPTARAGRLLWATAGRSPRITPAAVRRLASDATLQLVLTDGAEILGVAAPTPVVPARVKVAVTVRDQGCRFPGCRAPMAYCDLHHVVPREHGGHTMVDNLVALCRRHHTAVTQGRWSLTMTADGVVTVRRGRRTATSDPPLTADPPLVPVANRAGRHAEPPPAADLLPSCHGPGGAAAPHRATHAPPGHPPPTRSP